jgi:hypothetical protein
MTGGSMKSRRVLSQVAAAGALAFVASSAVLAHAGAPKVDVGNSAISCATVTGSVKVAPPLVFGGTSTQALLVVKGTLSGCQVVAGNVANGVTGTFTAKLLSTSNDCSGLVGAQPLTGNLTVKWKSNPLTPLLQTSSTIAINSIVGGVFDAPSADPAFGGNAYAEFELGISGVSGAFTGGDNGVTSDDRIVLSQDIAGLVTTCGTFPGVKSFNLGIGYLTLQ